MAEYAFDSIEAAIEDIRAGKLVIVVDDADRENEGDLIMAAEKVTPEAIAFMVRHTSGVICAPLTGERLDALEIEASEEPGEARRKPKYEELTRELLQVERDAAVRLRNEGRINDEVLRQLEHDVDLREARLMGGVLE
jgi:3,4-dihydroxy 2-butanone 4-phosphate synthase/GTP cyclohydrolase II